MLLARIIHPVVIVVPFSKGNYAECLAPAGCLLSICFQRLNASSRLPPELSKL